jgi:hypothetical protein
MKTTKIVTLAAVPALALAAGCGSGSGIATSHLAAPVATSQAPAQNNAGYSAGPDDNSVAQTVRIGQPFDVTYSYSSGGSAAWRMTLQSVKCGGSAFDPKIIASYYTSQGQSVVMPKPDPGKEFCLVKFSVTNEAHANDVWSVQQEATLNVGQDAYSDESITGPGTDAMSAYNASQPNSQYGLDPHATGPAWGVFEIPAGSQPTSVSVADDTALQTINGPSLQVLITLASAPAPPASAPPASAPVSYPASQDPATHPASPATPAGYLGNIFGGGTGNPCNFASGYHLGVCNPTGESQSQYIANPGGPAPGTPTNSQGCYYVKMGEGYCPSTGKYIPMHNPSQPSPPPAAPSNTGDPSNGSGTGAACTTVAGYYQAGLPGHEDSSGFCVAN